MQNSAQLLAQFEQVLRGLIRAEIREAQATQPPQPPVKDRFGGIELACEITGKARQTIYNLVSKRLIPHSRPKGSGLTFSEKDLREWMEANRRPMQEERAGHAAKFIIPSVKKPRKHPKK
jgi:excisionase family DNA binding protein